MDWSRGKCSKVELQKFVFTGDDPLVVLTLSDASWIYVLALRLFRCVVKSSLPFVRNWATLLQVSLEVFQYPLPNASEGIKIL
jgi:hypothetical protein